MASGILGKALPAAETYATAYTVPAEKTATVNISACNTGAEAAVVRIAITSEAGDPVAADFIEYGTPLTASDSPEGPLLRTGEVVGAGEKVVVWSDKATVAFRVSGFEGVE